MQGAKHQGGRLEILGLRLRTRIGVTEEERETPQEVRADLFFVPVAGMFGLGDDLNSAVDYSAVAELARVVAASGERGLIETLAEEILDGVMCSFPVAEVEVAIHKYALPGTDSVAVRIWRRTESAD